MTVPLISIDTNQLNKFGLTKDSFQQLLDIAANQSLFTSDGVAMIGELIASKFLYYHEKSGLNNFQLNSNLYTIDETLMIHSFYSNSPHT